MNKEIIKNVFTAWMEVQEKKLSDKQKKHMDTDKDGDIDGTDLANLRAKKESHGETCSECGCDPKNPKKGCDCDHENNMESYDGPDLSVFSEEEISKLIKDGVFTVDEAKDKHTAGATKPEGLLDKESGKSKEFVANHKVNDDWKDYEEKGHEDASKAGRATKQSSGRRGDNLNNGDSKTPKKA